MMMNAYRHVISRMATRKPSSMWSRMGSFAYKPYQKLLSASSLPSPSPRNVYPFHFNRFFSSSQSPSHSLTMESFLDPEYKKLLTRVRTVLGNLNDVLLELHMTTDDETMIHKGIQQLDQWFLLVVVGEFNSGKSQFINALLGDDFCEIGVLPTTDKVNILVYGEKKDSSEDKSIRKVRLPVNWLKQTALVDTPGTNAILTEHQEITEDFLPRSDLIIFITSVERPFSQSERKFLEMIHKYGKKVIVVLNKMDLIEDPASRKEILDFVKRSTTQVLNEEPPIFNLSSLGALDVKYAMRQLQLGQEVADQQRGAVNRVSEEVNNLKINLQKKLKNTGFCELENYIGNTLGSSEKLKLKLENPLGVAEHILSKYKRTLEERKRIWSEDQTTLRKVKTYVELYKKDMKKDFLQHLLQIDNIFLKMENDTNTFLTNHFRLINITELIRSGKFQKEFDNQVNKDTQQNIDDFVLRFVDWMTEKTQRQIQKVSEYIVLRSTQQTINPNAMDSDSSHILHEMGIARPNPVIERADLTKSLLDYSREVSSPKQRKEAMENLNSAIQTGLMATAAVEVGALGLGGLSCAAMMDLSGLAGASAMALAGLYVIPVQRIRLNNQMRSKINIAKEELSKVVCTQFDEEMQNATETIDTYIEPFDRSIRVEKECLETISNNLVKSTK